MPTTYEQQRKQHLARQARSNALKQLKAGDGTKVYNSGYHIPDKNIFGIVAESHPVDP